MIYNNIKIKLINIINLLKNKERVICKYYINKNWMIQLKLDKKFDQKVQKIKNLKIKYFFRVIRKKMII